MPDLPKNYKPSEDEPFMNPRQKEYFRQRLISWKDDILNGTKETIAQMQEDVSKHPDELDKASHETLSALELRTRDRQRKLISKIDAALRKIQSGTYGYCEETGEPIALKRLVARPIATLSLEAQERHERMERIQSD